MKYSQIFISSVLLLAGVAHANIVTNTATNDKWIAGIEAIANEKRLMRDENYKSFSGPESYPKNTSRILDILGVKVGDSIKDVITTLSKDSPNYIKDDLKGYFVFKLIEPENEYGKFIPDYALGDYRLEREVKFLGSKAQSFAFFVNDKLISFIILSGLNEYRVWGKRFSELDFLSPQTELYTALSEKFGVKPKIEYDSNISPSPIVRDVVLQDYVYRFVDGNGDIIEVAGRKEENKSAKKVAYVEKSITLKSAYHKSFKEWKKNEYDKSKNKQKSDETKSRLGNI